MGEERPYQRLTPWRGVLRQTFRLSLENHGWFSDLLLKQEEEASLKKNKKLTATAMTSDDSKKILSSFLMRKEKPTTPELDEPPFQLPSPPVLQNYDDYRAARDALIREMLKELSEVQRIKTSHTG